MCILAHTNAKQNVGACKTWEPAKLRLQNVGACKTGPAKRGSLQNVGSLQNCACKTGSLQNSPTTISPTTAACSSPTVPKITSLFSCSSEGLCPSTSRPHNASTRSDAASTMLLPPPMLLLPFRLVLSMVVFEADNWVRPPSDSVASSRDCRRRAQPLGSWKAGCESECVCVCLCVCVCVCV